MSAHLGDRVSALVDGQLSPAATERALAHVTGCARCASDLAAARAARRVLCDVDDVRPAGDLTARLLALGGCTPGGAPTASPGLGAPSDALRPARTPGYGTPAARPLDPFVPPSGRPTARPAALPAASTLDGLLDSGRALLGQGSGVLGSRTVLGSRGVLGSGGALGRRGLRATVGSITGLGVVAVGLFVLGDRPAVTPVTTASSDALSVLGGASVDVLPVVAGTAATTEADADGPATGATTQEYLDWMRAQGWTCPAEVPAGWSVTSVRLRDEGSTLEIDLTGPTGGDVVVTEQQGRLDASALTAADRLDLDGRTVYLLSRDPWHAAWQAGDTVVEVVSGASAPETASVVAQFPDSGFDAGITARLNRGWDTFTAAMHLP